jgi:hypothetical protein
MADWGRGRGGGRRGRGRRPSRFFPKQQSPLNLLFFPGYGYDPYLQLGWGGGQFRPHHAPYPRGVAPKGQVQNQGGQVQNQVERGAGQNQVGQVQN